MNLGIRRPGSQEPGHALQIEAYVTSGLLIDGANPTVAIDSAEMHADLCELAVPFSEDPLAVRTRARGESLALHPIGFRHSGYFAKCRSEIEMTNRLLYDGRSDSGGRSRAPDQGHSHQRIDVIRPLVEQAEITLQLTVVGGKDDISAMVPFAFGDPVQNPPERFIDEFIFNMDQRVDFADLIRSERAGNKADRAALIVAKPALVPLQPMGRLLTENRLDLFA